MNWTKTLDKNRASGVIIKNEKLLLIHRIREGREYWVFPGGSIEESESTEQALDREIAEELGLEVQQKEFLFEIKSAGRSEYYFFIKRYTGEPKIGGPELGRMNAENQYILEERDLAQLSKINLLPTGVINELQKFLPGIK